MIFIIPQWRFGWLEGEKPVVEIAPDNPAILAEREKKLEAKRRYIEETKRLLQLKKEREDYEKLNINEDKNDSENKNENEENIDSEISQQISGCEGSESSVAQMQPAKEVCKYQFTSYNVLA